MSSALNAHLPFHCVVIDCVVAPTPTGGVVFQRLTPLELLDRLTALLPPPRIHRHRYYGVLAPDAPLRQAVTTMLFAPGVPPPDCHLPPAEVAPRRPARCA
ncbi:MAG: transposase [Betaproteobacteria bacterium]